ncbi:MAG TPA: radical SAM protein, partial [Candidatus Krumholzibacterium sp.]|nr:radical SAM protein [Candidatus Krumholzibacterium sp.]
DLPRRPIVPSSAIVHERLSVEIMRGCTRGCRFCHAGISYRPRRERSVDEIVEAVCEGLDSSGWEEVSLLSLSSSDYSRFGELLDRLSPELEKRRVSLSMPSLRPETVCEQVVTASGLIRRSGFTLAPEAGTQRLRDVINKGMTEEEILRGCARILDAGWQNLKLYFMIGLPGETDEDVAGIASLIGRISDLAGGRRRMKINVSVSPFVPRVNTPFQWERQASIAEIAAKERRLRSLVDRRGVQVTVRDPKMSALEGVFARGGESLWPVVLTAFERGCRFDGWRDNFDFDRWNSILEECGFTLEGLLSGFEPDEELPWERFGLRVTRDFLLRERERAFREEVTEDCRTGACSDCGACREPGDREAGRVEASAPLDAGGASAPDGTGEGPPGSEEPDGGEDAETVFHRYRLSYYRTGQARFISHRESINVIH